MSYLYYTVSVGNFIDLFDAHGRGSDYSYEGLQILYNYLQETADDLGEPLQVDVVGICCDYSEYQSAADMARDLLPDDHIALLGDLPDDSDTDTAAQLVDLLRDDGYTVIGRCGCWIVGP